MDSPQPALRLLTNAQLVRHLARLCLLDVQEEKPVFTDKYVHQLCSVLDSENQIQVLRYCRRAAAYSTSNQNLIFEYFNDILVQLVMNKEELPIHCLALQVIGNTLVANATTSEAFLSEFGLDVIKIGANSTDSKVSDASSMVGLILTQVKPDLVLSKFQTEDLCSFLDKSESSSSAYLWLECLLKHQDFVQTHYESLSQDYKVKLLELIISNTVCLEGLPNESVSFFAKLVATLAETILNSKGTVFPDEVTSLIELFCRLMLLPSKPEFLAADQQFVTSIIVLLRGVHDAGQIPGNTFTPIHKMDQIENQDLQDHPAFAFKAKLIRLVGGLVAGNKENQDKVHDLGALRVILECTRIDALNPFIPQCAILALKFLLENNKRNQDFVNELRAGGERYLPIDL